MLPPLDLNVAIDIIVREQRGRLLAALTASIGDLQLAEDVLQDAVTIALVLWQQNGIPDAPASWLLQTARRKAIDRFRREKRFSELQAQISYELDLANEQAMDSHTFIPDKRLELIFTCCHPAIDQKSRVALTLHTLGGLTTDEIANAHLVQSKTMAQRLVRAKKKISLAGIPFSIPQKSDLNERVITVLSVLYLIFNEGYCASAGNSLARADLSDEAIRLARILHQLLPDQTEVAGLLSLMLLHDSRRHARESADHDFIPLEAQNRNRWDRRRISEGCALLKTTMAKQQIGPYQLQAAISAIHAEAQTWEQTDWHQISALYQLLYQIQPSSVVRINQAVAVSYADCPEAALTLLENLEPQSELIRYQPYYVAKADILTRLGKTDSARENLENAISLSDNEVEKKYLQSRLDNLI